MTDQQKWPRKPSPLPLDALTSPHTNTEAAREKCLLDDPPAPRFDVLTAVAVSSFRAEVAWISFLDRDRQIERFKSQVGTRQTEASVVSSFWKPLLENELIETSQVRRDDRFCAHPVIANDPRLHACMAVPVVTRDGITVGVFAVATSSRRRWNADQKRLLRVLARQAGLEIDFHRLALEQSIHTDDTPDGAIGPGSLGDLPSEPDSSIDDAQPVMAWLKTEDGRYLFAGQTPEIPYFPCNDGNFIGMTDFDVFPEDVARQLRQNDEEVLASDRPAHLIEEVPGPGGGRQSWQVWKFPFSDPTGRRFIGGIGYDLSYRQKALAERRAIEERYRSLVEGARDAIFTIAPDGTLTGANRAAELITGLARQEWIHKNFMPLVHPDDTSTALTIFHNVLEGDTPPPFELRIRTAAGTFIPMELTVAPEWFKGKVHRILGVARDLRKRRHLEEQLRNMQKLDSIGRLAAGIAHDFNNILTVQQGYLALLLEAKHPKETRELLEQIALAVSRGGNLTRQLMAFSRNQIIHARPLHLHEVVSRISEMLVRILGEDIALEINATQPQPPVFADVTMMEQVVMNLAANARDAMPGGGRLTIATEAVNVSKSDAARNPEARAGFFVRLTIADTGSGVSPDAQKHLFEPFFTTKEIGKGTGLGLATVHGIVKQHQGWIELETWEDQGTRFDLFLPVHAGDVVEEPAADDTAALARGSETVLVVEDERPVRDMVCLVLESCGYTVVTSSSGADARLLWPKVADRVDLLLTDVVMPEGVSGVDLARELIHERPGLKLLFTSGYSAELTTDVLDGRRPVAFLPKPYTPATLARTVRDVLDG